MLFLLFCSSVFCTDGVAGATQLSTATDDVLCRCETPPPESNGLSSSRTASSSAASNPPGSPERKPGAPSSDFPSFLGPNTFASEVRKVPSLLDEPKKMCEIQDRLKSLTLEQLSELDKYLVGVIKQSEAILIQYLREQRGRRVLTEDKGC